MNTALSVLSSFDLEIPTVALAKQEEDLYLEDDFNPDMDTDSKNLLIKVRNEAHRFAIKNLRNMKRKASVHSPLDDIPGLGPKRKVKLLDRFGSIDNLKKAKLEEIQDIVNNSSLSETIFNFVKTLK